MTITRSVSARILLGVVTLMCIGYIGCGRSAEKANDTAAPTATPGTETPTPAPTAAQQAEVPGTGTPTSATESATPQTPAAPRDRAADARARETGAALTAGGLAAPPPPPPPRVFTLSSSTPISIYTTTELSTKTSRAGDTFTGTLARPIVDKDWVVAKDGAPVEGVVLSSDPGGRVKGVASISVALRRLTLADGRHVEISTSAFTQKAKTTKTKDAEKIIGGAGVGALIGALAGGRKGAAIGAGAEIGRASCR